MWGYAPQAFTKRSGSVLSQTGRVDTELGGSCRERDTSTSPNLNLSRKTSVLLDGLAFVVDPRDVLSINSSRPFSDLSDWRWHVAAHADVSIWVYECRWQNAGEPIVQKPSPGCNRRRLYEPSALTYECKHCTVSQRCQSRPLRINLNISGQLHSNQRDQSEAGSNCSLSPYVLKAGT